MSSMNLVKRIPPMMMGEELEKALQIMPDYDESIRDESEAVRLMALSDLRNIFIPNQMAKSIYCQLYLSVVRSMKNKESQLAVKQMNENARAIRGQQYSSLLNGSSFTIIGASGIGKTSAIGRAIDLMGGNDVIEIEKPYMKIIPCMLVQCPFDSSIKGMLLEILRTVDAKIDTHYYEQAIRARASCDGLLGAVSTVCIRHVSTLIVDEIQNVVNSKNGKNLVASLTQLINNSGISIAMIGMPECRVFFEQGFQLARRSLGLYFEAMEYDETFQSFCETMFRFQYVKNKTEISEAIIQWLFEHSQGNVSIVTELIYDAQEMSICDGREILNIETLNDAYKKRLTLLHSYINPSKKPQISRLKKETLELGGSTEVTDGDENLITTLVSQAKWECIDAFELLEKYIVVERVSL